MSFFHFSGLQFAHFLLLHNYNLNLQATVFFSFLSFSFYRRAVLSYHSPQFINLKTFPRCFSSHAEVAEYNWVLQNPENCLKYRSLLYDFVFSFSLYIQYKLLVAFYLLRNVEKQASYPFSSFTECAESSNNYFFLLHFSSFFINLHLSSLTGGENRRQRRKT